MNILKGIKPCKPKITYNTDDNFYKSVHSYMNTNNIQTISFIYNDSNLVINKTFNKESSGVQLTTSEKYNIEEDK